MVRKRIRKLFYVILGFGILSFLKPLMSPPSPLTETARTSRPAPALAERAPASTPPAAVDTSRYNIKAEGEGPDVVYINGKYHLANPNNVYMIDGVPTYVLEKDPVAAADEAKKKSGEAADDTSMVPGLGLIETLAPKSTNGLVQHMKQINANLKERNAVLKELSQ